MKQDFLLESELAKKIYTEIAKDLPIIDYHNHLCIEDIASDRIFKNITELWLSVDPYKHRAMRILGIPEKYITGDASDFEKFEKWYECIPRLFGNPLYDWSLMEFSKVFEIELYPFQRSACEIWDEANEKLKKITAKKILEKFKIEYCAPCVSLLNTLNLFDKKNGICPSLRADDIMNVDNGFIEKLECQTNIHIQCLDDFYNAIEVRLLHFKEKGCKYTDHALDDGFSYFPDDGKNESRFKTIRAGNVLSDADRSYLFSEVLRNLAGLYAKHGLTMQLHIGAKRETSTRLRKVAGPAGGYAAIGHCVNVGALTSLLDDIELGENGLPKIVLFTLNPADNAVFSILSGSYSKDGVQAVISQGPAWWWCDHRQGIIDMLEHLSVYGVMFAFIGMTTDSRSLLSFVRHDYFRRILCNWLSEKVQKGIWPEDNKILKDVIENMCYYNALKTVK